MFRKPFLFGNDSLVGSVSHPGAERALCSRLRLEQGSETIPWWAQVDSNHRPRAYQARALTN